MAMEEIQETELSKDAEQETEFSQREPCKAGNKQEETEEHSSPRGVLEIPITGSDSDHGSIDRSSSFGSEKSTAERGESSSSSSSSLSSSPSSNSYGSLYWKKMLGQVKKRSVMSLSNIPSLLVQDLSKKALRRKLGRNRSAEEAIDCGDLVVPKPSWRNFSYQELTQATDDFSPDKLIGKGGHAEVYRGFLPDGQVVAVKKITKKQKNDDDRVGDFLSELGIIAHIDHPNAAKLFGFSADSGLHLILHFCPHGSLADMLHGSGETLEWKLRFKVATGVAEGLHYLHCECPRRIIHRDITASNILLSDDYEAQISDFGLAKWLPEKWVHHVVSPIEGTFGYMAPEYFMHGIVDEKTDVFAFGVLLLELMTGRRAVDSCRQSLVMWAKPLLEKNNAEEIADPRLGDSYDVTEMKRAMYAASICIHHAPNMRPDMLRVVQLLKGEKEAMEMKQKLMGGGELLLDPLDLETYTSTTYLKDLNRHRQLVME